MKHSFLFRQSFLFILLLGSLPATAYKKESIDINVNGTQRNMVVFSPNTLPAKSPLMIVTHGMNQNPEYQYDSDKIYEMVDTAKFVVTYLRSDGNTWDIGGTKDRDFVVKTIDEMATRFDIDKERVYWSGFSMGSMLIHHCISSMQDKIAAFAPTSGIQFSESPWNSCSKPVVMLECIAYGDDVFGYEQYGIHNYIESYARHDNHVNYSKTTGYRPINGCWYDGDLEKWSGGPNGGEVWLYSYNNGGHWPMSDNRHLIWNFCKRYSLNMSTVRIAKPAGETSYLYMAPQGEESFPDIAVRATPKLTNCKLVKMDFYDGKTLLESKTASPYTTTIESPKSGKHNLRVVITDSKDRTAEATCLVNYMASRTTHSISQHFTTAGTVPQDWYVSNGSVKRAGGGLTYADGPRLLQFTASSRGFDYGLLVQNLTGKTKVAYAKYGVSTGRSTLTLYPGSYAVKYKVCNWNQPDFSPVTVAVLNSSGQEVASQTFTPTVNIGGDTANKFARITAQAFDFEITETDNYVIAFYTDEAKNSDFVLSAVTLLAKEFTPTGISEVKLSPSGGQVSGQSNGVQRELYKSYDLSGREVNGVLPRGIYIVNGQKVAVQ